MAHKAEPVRRALQCAHMTQRQPYYYYGVSHKTVSGKGPDLFLEAGWRSQIGASGFAFPGKQRGCGTDLSIYPHARSNVPRPFLQPGAPSFRSPLLNMHKATSPRPYNSRGRGQRWEGMPAWFFFMYVTGLGGGKHGPGRTLREHGGGQKAGETNDRCVA